MLQNAIRYLALPLGIIVLGLVSAQSAYAYAPVYSNNTPNGNSALWGDTDDCATNGCGYSTQITPSTDLVACEVWTRITWNGNATSTGNVYAQIYDDGPETSLITSKGIPFTSLPTGTGALSATSTRFVFENCSTLSGGDPVYITFITDSSEPRNLTSALYTSASGYLKMAGWNIVASKMVDMQIYGFTSSQYAFPTSTMNLSQCSGEDYFEWYDPTSWFASSTLRQISCVLFNPTSDGMDAFNQAIDDFTGVFPFNIFFRFNDIAQYTIESYGNGNLTLSLPLLVSSTTVPILSSSTLENFVGTSVKNTIFDLEKYMAWFAVGWWMYAITVKRKT